MSAGEYRYTKTHEWARLDADGQVTVGITTHAQELLGDIVYVQLPARGQAVEAAGECGAIESVKAAADLYSPLAGEIAETNAELSGAPELLNQDPQGAGWILKMRPTDTAAWGALLDEIAYKALVDSESH